MADEMDQLPTVLSVTVVSARMIRIIGKRGHTGESHAIFDNPEQFPIAQVLRRRFAQIRRFWIKAASNRRVPTAVVPMTYRAVIRKVQPGFALYFGRIQDGILR